VGPWLDRGLEHLAPFLQVATSYGEGAAGGLRADLRRPALNNTHGVATYVSSTHLVRTSETTLVVLRSTDGEVVFSTKHEGLIEDVAFDTESHWVALRSGDMTRVFDVREGQETSAMAATAHAWFPVRPSPEEALPEFLSERDTLQSVWSTNGLWLVTRHPGRVRVWDRTTMSDLTVFPITTDTTGIAISSDDRYLAIGGGDGDLQIRTLPDGVEIAVLPHDGAVTKFAFSPDGNFVVSAGVDAFAILMWIVSPDILMDDVRRRLDRDLTRGRMGAVCWKRTVRRNPRQRIDSSEGRARIRSSNHHGTPAASRDRGCV